MENRDNDIREQYGEQYVLRQLAEECSELAQAALKVVRVMNKETPVSSGEAWGHLVEEMADVGVMCDMVGGMLTREEKNTLAKTKTSKRLRMYERMLEGGVHNGSQT